MDNVFFIINLSDSQLVEAVESAISKDRLKLNKCNLGWQI
jgi:ribosome recycling factor